MILYTIIGDRKTWVNNLYNYEGISRVEYTDEELAEFKKSSNSNVTNLLPGAQVYYYKGYLDLSNLGVPAGQLVTVEVSMLTVTGERIVFMTAKNVNIIKTPS